MKLQDLHVLMTVLEAGSMGKAAKRLNTSQPAISRSVAELESAIGVRLLDRHRQGIKLTNFGRALVECGVAVFDDLRSGIKNIEFLADPTAGVVRIGTGAALAATFVSTVLEQVSCRFPGIIIHLINAEAAEGLHRELHARNVDFVIVQQYPVFSDAKISFEPLLDTSYVVVAGVQHPLARRRRIKFADLKDERWVLAPSEYGFGKLSLASFRAADLEYPQATILAPLYDTRISLLKSGRFLSILTTHTLSYPTKKTDLKVLPIRPIPGEPIGIATLKGRMLAPVAQRVIDTAREIANAKTGARKRSP
jgi:DNA-binding transcriptional LysR family regulator